MTHNNHRREHVQHKAPTIGDRFSRFAQATAAWAGHPIAFFAAVLVIVVWCVTGPIFHFSDTWQLVINTGTTIVTFLMVFLIQNTQNRDILTVQLKLSELVLAVRGAEDRFAAIEDLSDEELETLHNQCRARAEEALHHLDQRRSASRSPAARATNANRGAARAHKA